MRKALVILAALVTLAVIMPVSSSGFIKCRRCIGQAMKDYSSCRYNINVGSTCCLYKCNNCGAVYEVCGE